MLDMPSCVCYYGCCLVGKPRDWGEQWLRSFILLGRFFFPYGPSVLPGEREVFCDVDFRVHGVDPVSAGFVEVDGDVLRERLEGFTCFYRFSQRACELFYGRIVTDRLIGGLDG